MQSEMKERATHASEHVEQLVVEPCAEVPPLNLEKYREYVSDFDITEEQKNELLRTLWSIALTFVDLGFGVDAVQRIAPMLFESPSIDSADSAKQSILTSEN